MYLQINSHGSSQVRGMLGPAAWSLRSHGVGKVIVQPSREMTRRGRRAGTGTVCEAQSAERHSAKKLAIKFREAITRFEATSTFPICAAVAQLS